MSRVFDSIPDWITERSDKRLNAIVSNEKISRIKLALHICGERQTELVIMELADDGFFIPAIFKPDDIRKKFGLSDLQLSIDTLEERVLKIKTYAVSAYRCNNSLYPYLIVTDFEYIKGRSCIDSNLQHAYTMKQVGDWMDHVQQHVQNLHNPVSKMFPSNALAAQYRNLDTLERQLEAILSRMYRFEARVLASNSRGSKRLHSPHNHTERDRVDYVRNRNTTSEANNSMNHDIAKDEGLIATSSVAETHPSTADHPAQAEVHSRAPPGRLTLQEYLLSIFDTMKEIPDEICIDSGSPELTQPETPPPRSPISFFDLSATGPSLNTSPATVVTANLTPDPISSFPSYSPGPSDAADPMDSSDSAIPNSLMLLDRPYEFNRIPENFDSFKRRRLLSDLRLEYLK